MVITRRIYIIYFSSVPRLNLAGECMQINTSIIADGDPMWMWRYIQQEECMVTMTHVAKISGWMLNLLGWKQNWIKFVYKLIQKHKNTDSKLIKTKHSYDYVRKLSCLNFLLHFVELGHQRFHTFLCQFGPLENCPIRLCPADILSGSRNGILPPLSFCTWCSE